MYSKVILREGRDGFCSQLYTFINPKGINTKVGDYVIVDTRYGIQLGVVKDVVKDPAPLPCGVNYKPVLLVLDLAKYKKAKELEELKEEYALCREAATRTEAAYVNSCRRLDEMREQILQLEEEVK